ncbi:hypothetical protein OJAV_G00111420 [Oryzias javanicus]|uniref:Uncharacterized protein n=1 Tax=Oryzias javanicus TaxID=123683 RepID=A0A3S2Q124_ORYJA|nr:hypothetical protein OJAV_G00111420 [Oryzias javanicus]
MQTHTPTTTVTKQLQTEPTFNFHPLSAPLLPSPQLTPSPLLASPQSPSLRAEPQTQQPVFAEEFCPQLSKKLFFFSFMMMYLSVGILFHKTPFFMKHFVIESQNLTFPA